MSNFGWPGSGVDWWIMSSSGKELTYPANFTSTGRSIATYIGNNGSNYYGHSVYAKIKTDQDTWNECDVSGKIYP